MVDIFRYEELTWPGVAGLPRSTPLLIPLGSQVDEANLARNFGTDNQIGVLPGIPFGWPGSSIKVEDAIFQSFIYNLVAGLLEDGFTNLQLLLPDQSVVSLNDSLKTADLFFFGFKGTQFEEPDIQLHDTEKVLLIPAGHTEQHGYHLPLSTDSLIIDAICQGVVDRIPEAACRLPLMPYGVSMHRKSFAGTLNAGGRIYEDFLISSIDSLVERGFKKYYLLSGHGGNCSFLVNVVKYIGEKYPELFCATAFLYLSGPKGIQALEQYRQSRQGGMGHACELETSLILKLRPDLVHMDRVVDETDFISSPSYFMDWIEGGALVANPPWYDDTVTGAYGAGSLATLEKGALWLQAAIAEKIDHVLEIQEQYKRRLPRKQRLAVRP